MVRQYGELFLRAGMPPTVMVNPDFVKIAEGYYLNAQTGGEAGRTR